MSRWNLLAIVPGLVVGSMAHAGPVLVQSPVHKVFTPLGFDDNDDSEVILHGEFPSSCYKVGPASATVDVQALTITIDAKAYLYQADECVDMLVPYIQPVKLGIIPSGDYKIVVTNRPDTEKLPLSVAKAQSRSADDFLYAPVAQVDVAKDAAGQFQLTLEGEYPYTFVGCMKIIEVRSQVTPGQVLVVQPISQMYTDNADCTDQATTKHYKITQPIDSLTDTAEYLAHVRALSGQSVNRVFDFR